jgi:hypothetical protein
VEEAIEKAKSPVKDINFVQANRRVLMGRGAEKLLRASVLDTQLRGQPGSSQRVTPAHRTDDLLIYSAAGLNIEVDDMDGRQSPQTFLTQVGLFVDVCRTSSLGDCSGPKFMRIVQLPFPFWLRIRPGLQPYDPLPCCAGPRHDVHQELCLDPTSYASPDSAGPL